MINREVPFVVRYRTEVLWICLTFICLLLLVNVLFISYRRSRRLARDLSLRNDEISKLNDSLSRSEAELQQRYDEISVIKESLEESEERYRLAAVGSNDVMWDWNYQTGLVHYSSRWYEMTGYPHDADRKTGLRSILHPADRDAYDAAVKEQEESGDGRFKCEARIKIANGAYKWILIRGKAIRNGSGEMIRFAGSITDIDDRKQKDDEIENLAYYDQLTSLPNRTLTMELARKALQTTKAGTRCGLMFIDIDNFKYVNDTFGHSVGDKVLVQIAGILSSLVNENISISRFGGDEFVMLVNNTNTEAMERFAQLVLRLTGRKLEIDGRYHFLTISAGIALSPGEESGLAELFQKADAALHRAKLAGKTRYQLYDDSIGDELVNRMEMESGLRTAIENGELYVAYQPLINVTTGRIEGMEALARWNNPRKGNIRPDEFIPIAESSGQIDRIGLFVLRSAARFITRADSLGYREFTVSVNLSVRQLQDSSFVPRIIRLMQEENVATGRISLEITESFMIEDLDQIIGKLNELKDAGFLLSLDDFGKGYSSLSYLRALPVNYIKIDKSFIDDIVSNSPGIPLARNIIALSHQLGLKVIAEGVEYAEQVRYLREHGCDFVQGYYYARPGTEDSVLGMLELSFS